MPTPLKSINRQSSIQNDTNKNLLSLSLQKVHSVQPKIKNALHRKMTKNFATVNIKNLKSKSKITNDLAVKQNRPAPVLTVSINNGLQRRITLNPNQFQRQKITKRLSASTRTDNSINISNASSGNNSKDKNDLLNNLNLDRVKEDKDELLGSMNRRVE